MTYDFRDQDLELAKFTATKSKEIMEEIGADHIDAMEELGPYDIRTYQSTHNTGGVLMGVDPDTSAVNNYLQMWDMENVYVVGASAFTNNSGDQPTGTVNELS